MTMTLCHDLMLYTHNCMINALETCNKTILQNLWDDGLQSAASPWCDQATNSPQTSTPVEKPTPACALWVVNNIHWYEIKKKNKEKQQCVHVRAMNRLAKNSSAQVVGRSFTPLPANNRHHRFTDAATGSNKKKIEKEEKPQYYMTRQINLRLLLFYGSTLCFPEIMWLQPASKPRWN